MRNIATTTKEALTIAVGVPLTYLAALAAGAGMVLASITIDLVERLPRR